jgi:uncharacterized membrane protein YdcZ (DUF606 family)
MSFSEPPEPAKVLLSLAIAVLAGALVGFFAGVIRQRSRSSGLAFVAATLFALGATWCFFIGLAFVYPHNHHDTLWIGSRPDWNYPIDVLVGLVVWASYLLVYRWWARARNAVHPRAV